jgi:hypothetical protein
MIQCRYPGGSPPEAMLEFAKALSCRDDAFYPEPWIIEGAHGHISETKGGFRIVVDAAMHCEAKKALTFADGDHGPFFLNRLPTFEEAKAIRRVCGIDSEGAEP